MYVLPDGSETSPHSLDAQLDAAVSDIYRFDDSRTTTNLRYSRLLPAYLATSWGAAHQQQTPRYAQSFGYAPEEMLTDLGDDVDPVWHMNVVHHDVVRLVIDEVVHRDKPGSNDPADITVSRASALIHDMGECLHPDLNLLCGGTIGDLTRGSKTPADRQLERKILETFIDQVYSTWPETFQSRVLDVVTHQEDSEAHELLQAAHELGFYNTGMRAGQLVLQMIERQDPEATMQTARFRQLSRLALEVTQASQPELTALSQDIPGIGRILDKTYSQFDQIVATVPRLDAPTSITI
jgi:hypothetical protein